MDLVVQQMETKHHFNSMFGIIQLDLPFQMIQLGGLLRILLQEEQMLIMKVLHIGYKVQ
jgi:hypothetical protein